MTSCAVPFPKLASEDMAHARFTGYYQAHTRREDLEDTDSDSPGNLGTDGREKRSPIRGPGHLTARGAPTAIGQERDRRSS